MVVSRDDPQVLEAARRAGDLAEPAPGPVEHGYRIALLQNQSEMRHNAYGDARRPLRDWGFKVDLFTAEAVQSLATLLEVERYHALVIASNALNDFTIRRALRDPAFVESLDRVLERGMGLVCFHQIALASDAGKLEFLSPPWDGITAIGVGGGGPQATSTPIAYTRGAASHPVLLFPNEVDLAQLRRHAREFKPLNKLWFHWWSGVRTDAWTPLLTTGHADRVLVAVARDPTAGRRIALCSPPADWQKSRALVENLLHFACGGSAPVAIVRDPDRPELNLIEQWLAAERVAFVPYPPGGTEQLATRIENGVHETMLLAPAVQPVNFSAQLDTAVDKAIGAGRLRVLGYGEEVYGHRTLWVVSRRLSVAAILRPLEAQVVAELDKGYIDGSFWSTVESLRALSALDGTTVEVDADLAAEAVRKACDRMDGEGSFDGTTTATCGLLWLLCNFGKPDDAKRTAQWLRGCAERLEGTFSIEALAALTALQQSGMAEDGDAQRLHRVLHAVHEKLVVAADPGDDARELHLLTALEAAHEAEARELEVKLATQLLDARLGRAWIDVETTATAIERLVLCARACDDEESDLRARLEQAVLDASVYIRHKANLELEIPWSGRIATSLMCVRALQLSNGLVDIPVSDTIDGLRRGRPRAVDVGDAAKAAGQVAQENRLLREDRERLEQEVESARGAIAATKKAQMWRNIAIVALVTAVTLYLVVYVVDRSVEQAGVVATVLISLVAIVVSVQIAGTGAKPSQVAFGSGGRKSDDQGSPSRTAPR